MSLVSQPKVSRACDNCRQKRTKCRPVPHTDPAQCVLCLQGNIACSWCLPISETRAKRRRTEVHHEGPSGVSRMNRSIEASYANINQNQNDPSPTSHTRQVGDGSKPEEKSSRLFSPIFGHPHSESRVRGLTSLSHLLHSTSTFPVEKLASFADRYRTLPTVKEGGTDAIMKIQQPSDLQSIGATLATPTSIPPDLPSELIDRLLQVYFEVHSPLLPVATKNVFISSTPVQSHLLYAMCGIGAMTHTANAPETLRHIQEILASLHKSEELLRDTSLQCVQALLIYSLSLEMEAGEGGTTIWKALGLAVRQAQDLGLHREIAREDSRVAELRRQVWGGLIVADRWLSTIYGLPMMIDLADCDRLFPADPHLRALMEVSIIQGRVLKLLYTPTGIMKVTNADAQVLNDEIENWVSNLPPNMQSKGVPVKEVTPSAGILGMLFVATKYLFCRPFMRINYTTDHLSFSITLDDFRDIRDRAKSAIEWASDNLIYLEGWQYGLYALFMCALLQYHSYTRTRSPKTLGLLRTCRDIMSRISNPWCFARTRMADLIELLYTTATEYTKPPSGKNNTLNPVPGVRLRAKDANVEYNPDKQAFEGNARVDINEPPIPQNLLASTNITETTPAQIVSHHASTSQHHISTAIHHNALTRPQIINENNINPMMHGLELPNEFGYGMSLLERWGDLEELKDWDAVLDEESVGSY